jgi:hypothetical protein
VIVAQIITTHANWKELLHKKSSLDEATKQVERLEGVDLDHGHIRLGIGLLGRHEAG